MGQFVNRTVSGMLQLAGAAILGAAVLLAAQPATAQESGNLARQVERLRRELADLQRYVYKGGQKPGAATTPADGGQPLSTDVAARMQVQITQMQGQVRTMNGRVEEVQHRITLLEQRLDRMSEDLEARLLTIEDALVNGTPSAAAATGKLPPEGGSGQIAVAPVVLPDLPEGTPREQYDFAYNLLKKHQWIEGRAALLAFLEKNPDDDLSDNASYWLGETYYINKQYKDAAKAFLEGYRKYPKADKAPDNLLKLGKSLAALNQPDKACTTYAKLLEDYPNSQPRIIKLAKSERKTLNCK